MESQKKLIVGYDLCEDFTQVCCYSYKTKEPIQISSGNKDENLLIPTVLCYRTDTKQWLFGEEAILSSAFGTGILVEQLLQKLQAEEELELDGQRFVATDLLEIYIRKSLSLIKKYFPSEQITKVVITIRETEAMLVYKLYEVLELLGLERDRAVIINHNSAYLYYALCQDKSLWMNDVGLFDFSGEGLWFNQIHINRRATPITAGIISKDYSDMLNDTMLKQKGSNPSYLLENAISNALYRKIITTLYFTGRGFDGNWAEEAIKGACTGRRVFLGQNIYVKGACYAAKELSGDSTLNEFLLLSDDLLKCSVSVRIYCDAKLQELPILQAGDNWYEANKRIEVIINGDTNLEIIRKDIMSGEMIRELLPISGFPKRPDRMTRLLIDFKFCSKTILKVTISDLGFGDVYPESGLVMEHEIEL